MGSFKQNPLYKRINETFKFEKKKSGQVNTYVLELDIITTKGKALKDEEITLKEFQK